jgi:hypothetical protein
VKRKNEPASQSIVWTRADLAALAAFDPATKVCTMNCGPARDDPRSDKERKLLCDDCLPAPGLALPIRTSALADREQMTDEWLRSAFNRAMFVGSNRGGNEDETVNDVLRGFANRVLQQFGDREGVQDALNIAYTKHKLAASGAPACGKVNDGIPCNAPKGTRCPDCGPHWADIAAGAALGEGGKQG